MNIAIEIMIRETLPNGKQRFATRWGAPAFKQGAAGWFTASNLGKDHREHADEAAARRALAGWLRSQAMLISPDDQVIEEGSGPPADAPYHGPEGSEGGASSLASPDAWDIPAAPSAAGLEDLL